MQITVKYDEVDGGDGKLVKKLSKGQRIIKKFEKPQSLKSCKGHWFGGTFTKALILRQRTQTFDKVLTVFRAFFIGPKSSLNTTFASIVDKAKLIELLIRCPHQAFICVAHAFLPLLQL